MLRFFSISLFLIVCFFPIYSQPAELIVIDLVNPQVETIPMSRLFNDYIEYVPLNTNEFCSMEKRASYYLTSQYIIGVNTFKDAYLFDRKTGDYIKQISKEGTGENEYRRFPIGSYGFDEKNNILYFHDLNQWKGFAIQGDKKVTKITMPKYSNQVLTLPKEVGGAIRQENDISLNKNNDWHKGEIHNPYPYGNDKYIGYVNNTTGDVAVSLVIFDKQGQVLKYFPNSHKYVKTSKMNPLYYGKFYDYHNRVYFMETYGDTLFAVYPDRIEPHIVFNMGDKKISYEEAVENVTYTYGRYDIQLVKETNSYVFFTYNVCWGAADNTVLVCGYYDKNLKKTYVCKTLDGRAGFLNDIDGLSDFNPLLITNKDEFLGVISPDDLSLISTDSISKRGIEIITQAKSMHAPIIIIVHLIEFKCK